MKRWIIFTVPVLVMLLQCGDGPEIIFPKAGNLAVVGGRVYPADTGVTAYLISAGGIDSAAINPRTEMFGFVDVPYGAYYLQVKAAGYGTTERQLVVDGPVVSLPLIKLTRLPLQVSAVVPIDGTAIDSVFITDKGNGVNDSTVVVRVIFRDEMDTASVCAALGIVPAMNGASCSWKSDRKNLFIDVPRGALDGDGDLVITIDTGAADRYGHHLERALVVSYPVAAGLGNVIAPQYLISSKRPDENGKSVSPSTPVMIWFDSVMHEGSVEDAFSIFPEASSHFVWDYTAGKHRVTVTFPGGLLYGTRYTVTLAAGWRTADSSMAGGAWSFSFETERPGIKDFSPKNGERSVLVAAPLLFTTNFKVGAAPFLKALNIAPKVDSLHFSFNASMNKIRIDHTPFDSGTAYTITVDSTLTAPDSSAVEGTIKFTFTTLASPAELDASDTVAWIPYPADGSSEWQVGREVSITFAEAMRCAAVESLLTITPAVSWYAVWADPTPGGHKLEIRPRHYLWSNTTYSVVIDSGYPAVSGRKNNEAGFSFTTQPLRCIGHSPAHGQINVAADSTVDIYLAFNMPVAVATLAGAVSVTPETAIARRAEKDTAHALNGVWKYGFSLNSPRKNTEYHMTVAPTITDLFGIHLQERTTFSFSTGE